MMSLPPAATPQPPPTPDWPLYNWRTINPSAQLLYLRSLHDVNREVPHLESDYIGFDLEWKPNYRPGQPENPVALVQLANNDRILLIQISAMSEFPEKLKELLENPDVLKAGAGIQKDAEKLFRDCNVSMRGCVDLALLARTVDNAQWKGPYKQGIGLARLLQAYHSLTMAKGKVQRSNWERYLTADQQTYAANDAHGGYIIYAKLEEMMREMTITPKTDFYSFDCIKGRLCKKSGDFWFPENPNYDPGPPPPPRERRKERRSRNVTEPDDNPSGLLPTASSSSRGEAHMSNEHRPYRPAFRKNSSGQPHRERALGQSVSQMLPQFALRRNGWLYSESLPPMEQSDGKEEWLKNEVVQMGQSTQLGGIQSEVLPPTNRSSRDDIQTATAHRPYRPAFRGNTRGRRSYRHTSSRTTHQMSAPVYPALNEDLDPHM